MKRLLALVLAMLMIFSLVGCGETPASTDGGSQPGITETQDNVPTSVNNGDFDAFVRPAVWSDDGSPFKVAVMIQYVTCTAALRSMKEFDIIGNHYGWEFEYVLFEKADNFRDSFQTVLNEGDVDAILIHATDQLSSRVDLIAEARNRGIGVYCWDADLVEGSLVNVTVKNGVVGSELFYKIQEFVANGEKSAVFISSEIEELLALCNTIYVFVAGNTVARFSRENFNKVEILKAAVGGAHNEE